MYLLQERQACRTWRNCAKRWRNPGKTCNFPILSLFSFHILHFFSFVFGSGGFLSCVLVYLLLFDFFWFWEGSDLKKITHANGEWGPKKENRVWLGFGWSFPVDTYEQCVFFQVAFLILPIYLLVYLSTSSKHSVCSYIHVYVCHLRLLWLWLWLRVCYDYG